ncbi:MAG: hypothetical protein Mars2KO_05030 [Maribacter sp.]
MTNKNFNQGQINTGGGNLQIGDNVTYFIDGLAIVLNEYKEQLKAIEQLINGFKPRTALKLLEEIESRINEGAINDNKISSKIQFLKASCKSELVDYSIKVTANEFVQSYLLNKEDRKLKEKACIEYLNLDKEEESIQLIEEIISIDANNLNAWFAKLLISKDFEKTLLELPQLVSEDYNFQLNLIYWIVKNSRLNFIEDLEKYGLTLNIDLKKYKTLTYPNKQAWIVAIDLLINKIFNDYPIRYISGHKFAFEDEQIIDDAITFLEAFLNPLQESEIKESIYHQSFFYQYFKYYKTKDEAFMKSIEVTYNSLHNLNWFYTMTFCQVLNYNEEFEKSLSVVKKYEDDGGEKISELFLFKAVLLFLSNRKQEIPKTFGEYLSSINIIDERVGFNLLNAFLNSLYDQLTESEFKQVSAKVLSKEFSSKELKLLFDITCQIRYLNEFDSEKLYSDLLGLIDDNSLDINYKDLLSENLLNLGKLEEAISFMSTYVDKTKTSPSLKLYVLSLEQQLSKNKEGGRGVYKELLELLKFYRLRSKYPDKELLGIEHNLNLQKNDWSELKEIDYILYQSFPSDESYLFFYLICLEKLEQFDEISNISKSIKGKFENEHIGVGISRLLLRNNIDIQKGRNIMYNLASNKSNIEARKYYLGISHLFGQDYFKKYEVVEKGTWVKYSIDIEKVEELKIEKDTDLHKEFIGRKLGDKFIKENKLTGLINTIEVIDIYNDELQLSYDIQKEIQNPLNELGFASFQVPEKIEDFEKLLVEQFGMQGSQEKKIREKYLNDYYTYQLGFTEIVRVVFRNNPIDAYLYLTSGKENMFTTLPSSMTKEIPTRESSKFALDITSLMLFFNLEKELDFKFINKFSVSFILKEWIGLLLTEEKHSRESPLSLQITDKGIRRFYNHEDYKKNRIEFFESLLVWINNNCETDLVEEKLDITYKLDEKMNDFDYPMKLFVDNMHLSMREDFNLISSNSGLLLFQIRGNLQHNIVNPEKYLLKFFPEKCNTEFYRHLLKANYIGINISLDTLKNEFYAMLVGNENYFNRCLDNLNYSRHGNPLIVNVISKFLKELYLINSILVEQKNRYTFEVLRNTFYGMPKEIVSDFENILKKEFVLLGDYYDEVLKIYKDVKAIYK